MLPHKRSRCRFIPRGAASLSESGFKRMRGGATRRCDRALSSPAAASLVHTLLLQNIASPCFTILSATEPYVRPSPRATTQKPAAWSATRSAALSTFAVRAGRKPPFLVVNALRAHTKTPQREDLRWRTLTAPNRPGRAQTVARRGFADFGEPSRTRYAIERSVTWPPVLSHILSYPTTQPSIQ